MRVKVVLDPPGLRLGWVSCSYKVSDGEALLWEASESRIGTSPGVFCPASFLPLLCH
jgi:hypothetical protein